MNSKLSSVAYGAFIAVLGILVAFGGIGTAVNTYIAVVSLIAGIALLILAAASIGKKLPTPVLSILGGAILITIAIALFAGKLSFAVLEWLLIFGLMGLGFGLIALGIIDLARRYAVIGLVEIAVGGLLVLFTALYLGVPSFRSAFWIVVGSIMIVYGVFYAIMVLMNKVTWTIKRKN